MLRAACLSAAAAFATAACLAGCSREPSRGATPVGDSSVPAVVVNRTPNEALCRSKATGLIDSDCLRLHVELDHAQAAYIHERTCLEPDGSLDRKCAANKTRLDGELSRTEDK